jgi:hypothetical protein
MLLLALWLPRRKLGSSFGPRISSAIHPGDFKNFGVKPLPPPRFEDERAALSRSAYV